MQMTDDATTDSVMTEDPIQCLFEQIIIIIAREDNVHYSLFRVVSQLNTFYYGMSIGILQRYKSVYYKHAPWLARQYAKLLIGHPVRYTGYCSRTIPIPNLLNTPLGLAFLDSDQPLFDNDFLGRKIPAFTNMCMLMRRRISFYYTIMIDEQPIVTKWVNKANIVELEPYSDEDIAKLCTRLGTDLTDPRTDPLNPHGPPGRFFVDLNLDFMDNPILLSADTVRPGSIYISISNHAVNIQTEHKQIYYVDHNVDYILYGFSHIIAQFKTLEADTDITEQLCIGFGELNTYVRKHSLVQKISNNVMTADELLSDVFDSASIVNDSIVNADYTSGSDNYSDTDDPD